MGDFTPLLKKALTAQGCYFVRQGKGDHEIWFSPISHKNFVVDGKIKSRHTANAALQQAGLEKQF
ncbi:MULTISPECIES: type II toxin-antitoxin system HicA family toxin [Methylomonas]|uniref:type II toxin-antitoxin system HicA family toxin n=1 Tax=Methylomonas TaxID=416 RepID=UPI001232D459|nr:type II toxin-antitoxin system HicA family toxin [Methylomonas rhizoryzae]